MAARACSRAMWIDQRGSEILARPECLRLLALEAKARGIGRLALSRPDAPIVQPVNFAYHQGELLVVLGGGFMVEAAPGQLVALEVDGVDHRSMVGWSVLVRGLARLLGGRVSDLPAGRSPVPLAPVPGERLLAVRPDVLTGRRFPLRRAPAPSESEERSWGGTRTARA